MDYAWEEEKLGKAYDAQLMRRLLRYVKPYRGLFALAVALSFVVTALELVIPYITKTAIDGYIVPATRGALPFERAFQGVLTLALVFTGVLLARLLTAFGQTYLLQYTGQRVMYDMRTQIFAHLMRLPVRFFDKSPVGRLVTRATNDVAAINEMYSAVLVSAFKDVFLIVGIFAIMLGLNWKLALLILLLMPLLSWVTFEFRKRAREAFREVRRKLAKLNAYLAESISGMRIIQLFVRERRSFEEFQKINREEYEAHLRQIMVFATFQPLIYIINALGASLILWYGGSGVLQGIFTLGSLVAFLSYVDMLFQPIRDLSEKYNILQGAMASSERIFQLLDEPEEHYEGRTLASIKGRIEFRDVWFSYQPKPQDEADWILKGVSFAVEPGERVAIVGPTGSGKTTIISLLLRLYEIQQGQILLDGVDIRELDLKFLRSQMAVVLQDVFLFSGDILGNIRLQSEKIPRERAIEAARFVQADEFIKELPQGYETEVKERGATLSVGQRQLLAFARAVAFEPKILILDEATANIDSKTEHLIQQSIDKIMEGRTAIVIAHRLSTIRHCDKILVLHKGRLVEQGTHEELLARKGLYHALYTLQFGETGRRTMAPQPSGPT
jgi:ATP-binding cassette subfamily B protein